MKRFDAIILFFATMFKHRVEDKLYSLDLKQEMTKLAHGARPQFFQQMMSSPAMCCAQCDQDLLLQVYERILRKLVIYRRRASL